MTRQTTIIDGLRLDVTRIRKDAAEDLAQVREQTGEEISQLEEEVQK